MSRHESSTVLNAIGWFFIPSLATAFLQSVYYRARNMAPPPTGSKNHTSDRQVIYALVIASYLIYSLYDAYREVIQLTEPGNELDYYAQLGVPVSSSLNELKRIFRRLSIQYHPDKIGTTRGNDHWVELKHIYEILSTPSLRFIYDRFGTNYLPDESIYTGIRKSITGYYAGSAICLVLLCLFRSNTVGKYWRFYILFCGFVAELYLITRTNTSTAFLPYQMIQFLRRSMITLFIGIERLGPLASALGEEQDLDANRLRDEVSQLKTISNTVQSQSSSLLHTQLMPFQQTPGMRNGIKQRVQDQFVENRLRNDPEVADAIHVAIADMKKDN